MTKLTQKCTQFLEGKLSAETAPHILEQSILFDEKKLKKTVLRKIQEEAPVVLATEDFTKLSKEALREILQLNLEISTEREVFEASMKWAENKCQELKKAVEGANIREVLSENLFLIRFPAMSVDDISNIVAPQDVLTGDEGYQIFPILNSEAQQYTSKSTIPNSVSL